MMARTFKDSMGREWSVVIDVWQLKLVRERTGFELGKLLANKMELLNTLFDDGGVQFVNVLYVLCEDQAKKVSVTDEQFGRSLGGDSLEAAFGAFWDAYLDFCPSQRREPLRKLAEKEQELRAAATIQAMKEVEAINVDETLARLTKTWNGSAGSSPESPESIPAPVG